VQSYRPCRRAAIIIFGWWGPKREKENKVEKSKEEKAKEGDARFLSRPRARAKK